MTAEFYELDEAGQIEGLQRLAWQALQSWNGTFDTPALIKYRENAVFAVRKSDGSSRAVLRVHRAGYHSDAQLESELQWMEALGAYGIGVPRVIVSEAGRNFVNVHCDSVPEPRQVDLLTWLDGSPVGAIENGLGPSSQSFPDLYFEAGKLAAQVHNQATAWELPTNFERHSWDADGLVGESPLWGRYCDLDVLTSGQRSLLQKTTIKLRADLNSLGKNGANYSLIHADFVPENLLVDSGSLKLIDFDDCGFGWHMFELATALYFYLDEPSYPALREALLAGYRTIRALSAEEEDKLDMFLLLRSLTYLGWVHTRRETQTAKELTGMFVERTCNLAASYLH